MTGDGNCLYVWQAQERGCWSQIVAFIPVVGVSGPLSGRTLDTAMAFRETAVVHGAQLGQSVRLARFECVEVVQEVIV